MVELISHRDTESTGNSYARDIELSFRSAGGVRSLDSLQSVEQLYVLCVSVAKVTSNRS
jgi:hypothetical protein